MAKKPHNPAIGTEFLKIQLKKMFAETFSKEELKKIENDFFQGRSLDEVLNLTPLTPIGDYLLLLTALRGKVSEKINFTWAPSDFMVMRYDTENFDRSSATQEWEDAKQAFIRSCNGRIPTPAELSDYENPDPSPLEEPAWMATIPKSL
jgi:hypothetical protein